MLILTVLAPLVLYWSSVNGGFVWDDRTFFIDNDILPNLTPCDIEKIFFHPSNYWGGELIPIREFLFVIERNLFGLNPAGYHVVSIMLYATLCVLLYYVLRELYRSDPIGLPGDSNTDIPPFFVTLLFALYPVHVEVVAYISEQKDLLCGLFSLLSVYFFFKLSTLPGKKLLLLAGVAAYYMALLSKVTAISLALFIPLLYLLRRKLDFKETFKSIVIWTGVNIPAILWVTWYAGSLQHYWENTYRLTALDLTGTLIRALKILGAHTLLAVKPYPLSFGYPFDGSTSFDANLLAGAVATLLSFAMILYFRKDVIIVFATCFFLLFLLPVLQIQQGFSNASIYDRYLFLSVLGTIMIGEKVLRLISLKLRSGKAVYAGTMLVAAAICAVISVSYIPTFRSDVDSTRNSYEKFPRWPSSSFNYVYSLIEGGRLDEAWDVTLREETFSSPPWVRSYFVGWICLQRGEVEKAISVLADSSALAIDGGYFPYPSLPLGRALAASGRYRDAELEFKRVLSSEIYQPLEIYNARREIEKIRLRWN